MDVGKLLKFKLNEKLLKVESNEKTFGGQKGEFAFMSFFILSHFSRLILRTL